MIYALSGRRVTYEEFLEISSKSEMRLEYIDGEIFVLSSPSIQHQRIASRLHIIVYAYLQGKPCQVFFAPFAVHLPKKG
ncbi:MAG: Uma2 family endonuclease [Bacillota bacterium]|nr:Uma2 family endonuclease [Bacillota bacterium]